MDQSSVQQNPRAGDKLFIEIARTGYWGKGRKLSDREIIGLLTSNCITDEALFEVAMKYAAEMGWTVAEFVDQAKRIGRSG